jgi:hypothetical protein
MKLHLGCGQVYLDGYVNIDYPLDQHSVQKHSVADKFADLTKLRYKSNSIDEIRLHHVYEHFDRATAVALLLTWRSWLKKDGALKIEVPDYQRTAISSLSPFTTKRKKLVGMRHIFGSQEAHWAIHYHGWSSSSLKELLNISGFSIVGIRKSHWRGTYNIEVTASKNNRKITQVMARKICKKWLTSFLVDKTRSELDMLQHWGTIANKQLKLGWAK